MIRSPKRERARTEHKDHMQRRGHVHTHREATRSGDADDGEEGAEVDSALRRRRHLVHDRGLLPGLGLVLRLVLGRLGRLGVELGLLLVLHVC